MKWHWQNDNLPTNIDELRTILLKNRGIIDAQSEKNFFQTQDPLTITLSDIGLSELEMERAVARIYQAIDRNERILIFGDYDVDGNCATALIWLTLKQLGVKNENLTPFIPHRQKHGYGLNERSFAEIMSIPDDQKPQLIITVDNGISANPIIQRIRQTGIEMIITDHHQPEISPDTGDALLPPAEAVIHTTDTCGATVAWFLSRELVLRQQNASSPEFITSLLDLVALAIVADQIDVLGPNRSLLVAGIKQLRLAQRAGIRELIRSSRISSETISTGEIGFILAPRLNSIGRLSNTLDSLRLLCTNSAQSATQLASILESTNQARRDLTADLFEQVSDQIEAQLARQEKILIVASSDFHEGVIGLIASRLVEKYAHPAVVLALSTTDQIAKGSARSVDGLDIIALLRQTRGYLTECGGHPGAAGCALTLDKFEPWQKQLWQLAKVEVDEACLEPILDLECHLPAQLVNDDLLPLITSFEPFGHGNPEFIFSSFNSPVSSAISTAISTDPSTLVTPLSSSALKLINFEAIGKTGEHLKLFWLAPSSSPASPAVKLTTLLWRANNFSSQSLPQIDHFYEIAFSLTINNWRHHRSLQLVLKDWRPVSVA